MGLSCAWLLQRRGHQVVLLDPGLPPAVRRHRNGSEAALGVLMAQVFHRTSGRAWRLRQRSLALWRTWLQELEARGHRVPQRRGLLLLAADPQEWQRQQRLVEERQSQELPLELWERDRLAPLQPAVPAAALGALHSPRDGQLDPAAAMAALLADGRGAGLRTQASTVTGIHRDARAHWTLEGEEGSPLATAPWLVLTAGQATADLLQRRGHHLPMEPVHGQAMTLELPEPPAWDWPGVAVWRGINLVPRPDLPGRRRFWLGASLEPGAAPEPLALDALRDWGGADLDWLATAKVTEAWQGARARPVAQPAPVLEQPEPGLLVATGHYRNGVLLAPATAEWVLDQVEAGDPPR